jgi:hypothetical protein
MGTKHSHIVIYIVIYIVKNITVADIPQQSINPTMARNPCGEKT